MSIKYRISQRKNNLKRKEELLYMFQSISFGIVDLEQINAEISNERTLTKIGVAAILMALGDKMQNHLEESLTVSLENIGRFKVGFKSKAHPNKKLLRKKRNNKIPYQLPTFAKTKKMDQKRFEIDKTPRRQTAIKTNLEMRLIKREGFLPNPMLNG